MYYEVRFRIRDIVIGVNSRARREGATGRLSIDDWFAICAPYDYRCVRCGSIEPVEMDHIVPLKRGGLNTRDNIQPLCKSCNCAKGSRGCTDYRSDPFQHQPIDGWAKTSYPHAMRLAEWERILPDLRAEFMRRTIND